MIDASDPTDGDDASTSVDVEPLDPNAAHICWELRSRQPDVVSQPGGEARFSFRRVYDLDTHETIDGIVGFRDDPHCPAAHFFHGNIPYHGTPEEPHVAMFEFEASGYPFDFFCQILKPGLTTMTSHHDRAPSAGELRFRNDVYGLTARAPDVDLRDELVRLVPDGNEWTEEPVIDLNSISFRTDGCDGRLTIDGTALHALPPDADESDANPDVRECRTIAYDGTFATSTSTPLWFSEPGFGWAIVCANWILSTD